MQTARRVLADPAVGLDHSDDDAGRCSATSSLSNVVGVCRGKRYVCPGHAGLSDIPRYPIRRKIEYLPRSFFRWQNRSAARDNNLTPGRRLTRRSRLMIRGDIARASAIATARRGQHRGDGESARPHSCFSSGSFLTQNVALPYGQLSVSVR